MYLVGLSDFESRNFGRLAGVGLIDISVVVVEVIVDVVVVEVEVV